MNTVEKLLNELDDLQERAMERRDEHESEEGVGPKSMYYLGKDIGIAEAKSVIRENADEIKGANESE